MAEGNPNPTVSVGSIEHVEVDRSESMQEDSCPETSHAQPNVETKAKIDDVWQQMNKGVSDKTLKSILKHKSSNTNKFPQKIPLQKSSTGWMTYLGLGTNKTPSPGKDVPQKQSNTNQNGVTEEAKKLAAAALSAVRESALLNTAGKGKIEVTEVRDFAGEDIQVKKLVDTKEAAEKANNSAAASGVDAVLEQIKKKQKLSVLDKTRKDWGEFKEENKSVEEELDAYKKSSNKYLDKVSFLQRTDYREFERERDARLALQAKRKTDIREDD